MHCRRYSVLTLAAHVAEGGGFRRERSIVQYILTVSRIKFHAWESNHSASPHRCADSYIRSRLCASIHTYIHTHEISPMRLAYGTALVRRNLRKGGRGEADMGGEFGMGCE